MIGKVIWSLMALILVAGEISAEVYKYVDDQGALHFVDGLENVPKQHRRKATVAGQGGSVSYTAPVPSARSTQGRGKGTGEKGRQFSGTVEIYMTSWCPACKAALSFVRENGIAHAAYDIEKDGGARRRFESLGGRGVPLIVVGDRTMSGFDPGTLQRWLGR